MKTLTLNFAFFLDCVKLWIKNRFEAAFFKKVRKLQAKEQAQAKSARQTHDYWVRMKGRDRHLDGENSVPFYANAETTVDGKNRYYSVIAAGNHFFAGREGQVFEIYRPGDGKSEPEERVIGEVAIPTHKLKSTLGDWDRHLDDARHEISGIIVRDARKRFPLN